MTQKLVSETVVEVRKPDFKGDGVAVWINTDKNGNQYLGIKLLGAITATLAAFPQKREDLKEKA